MLIALYLLVGLSAFMDLALGAWASVSWSSYVSTWRLADVCLTGDPRLLGLVLGLALLFFAVLQGLALYWIRKEKEQGHWILIAFGCYLIVSSLVTFLAFRQRPEFLLVDGLRGALLLVLTTVVLRSPATLRELRLPEREKTETRPGERVREMKRGQDRRRRGRGGERRSSGRSDSVSVQSTRRVAERPPVERSSDRRRGRRKPSARGGSTSGEKAEMESVGQIWSQRAEARTRSPEELIAAEPVLVNRLHRGESEEHPLTIVVKGGTGELRARSFLDEGETASDRSRVPGAAGEPDRTGDRRRRRRRHRSRSTDLGRGDRERGEESSSRTALPGRDAPAEEDRGEFEAEEVGRPNRASSDHSSEVVEALDMLSLLDPASKRSTPVSSPHGIHPRRVSVIRSGVRVSEPSGIPITRRGREDRETTHGSIQESAPGTRADDRPSGREGSA